MIERFFTTEQVANILQVHPFTILKFIKEGKLKGIKIGRVYRIKESDVKKFLGEEIDVEEQSDSKLEKKATKEKEKVDEGLGDSDHYYII
ncbi:MAG: helix-turn-helix domain-containing protein [Candidatus Gracilibacteria bacterium]|nr:helix-turn-helix domain-containing protein [Candidatus Gracilibacteria bacterium]